MIASLEHGRAAASRREWSEAVEALTAADRDEALSPDDLELLGNAAWWAGRPTPRQRRWSAPSRDTSRRAVRRTPRGWRSTSPTTHRARWPSRWGLWAAQANRLLEPFPASPLHAWMGVFEAANDLDEGRLDAGIELAD